MFLKNRMRYVLVAIIFFAVGLAVGNFFIKRSGFSRNINCIQNNKAENSNNTEEVSVIGSEELRDSDSDWKFINPLLDCAEINSLSNHKINNLKSAVLALIDREKAKHTISDVSIYFRDLNNGPWFGINEKEGYVPASLLKVPFMMSVFRQAMLDKDFLDETFMFKGESQNNQYFKGPKEIVSEHNYTVREILQHMIRYSDNNAVYILKNILDPNLMLVTYSELGIETPKGSTYIISARDYGSFLRILYNSTFLSREYSEEALRLLSETTFDKGLVAGLPNKVKVSHKFGERNLEFGQRYLHDCGIVYLEKNPYVLCVMTKGKDFDKLASFIAGVSELVYKKLNE